MKKEKLDTNEVISELTESAFFKPTSIHVDKPVKPLVEKYTTHLPPSMIDELKTFAFMHKLKDYQVVQVSITEFLAWHKDPDLVIWVTLFEVQSNTSVNDVIV